MSVDQFEEVKEANQKLKYSNERTSESWQKVEATAGSSLQKIESRVERGAVMIVYMFFLAGLPQSYPIHVLFSNILAEEFPSNLL